MAAFFSRLDIVLLSITVWLISKLLIPNFRRAHVHLTPLKGPESKSFFFGVGRYLINAADTATIYGEWASRFGLVYKVPGILGRQRVILCDPKAVAHFYARETTTYVQPPISKLLITKLLGGGIIIAEGEDHKRMRKALTPAFSPAAIRRLTTVFLDSAHKVKESWDGILDSSASGRLSIDVQTWLNRVSLDSMGIAGFSHDFNSLGGQSSSVASLFDSLAGLTPSSKSFITRTLSSAGTILFLLGTIFPILFELPTEQIVMFRNLRRELGEITEELLEKTKKEKELGFDDEKRDKSIIGLLINAEDPESRFHLSKEEISAQMITLLLAGYETTSISLTWALIELCNQPRIQDKLREELRTISSELTWDQVNSTELTYLDAVMHEVLRLHPPVDEVTRIAKLDDVLPLSTPLSLYPPSTVPWLGSSTHPYNTESVVIPKGTLITVPIACINKSEVFWGPDAKTFRPERWVQLENPDHDTQNNVGIPKAAQEISGYRHLLTFADGPRTCLGKAFAITEFKLVLAFLVRNYIFEFECENDDIPKIDMHQSILPRPKLEGQEGARVPLSVRRVE